MDSLDAARAQPGPAALPPAAAYRLRAPRKPTWVYELLRQLLLDEEGTLPSDSAIKALVDRPEVCRTEMDFHSAKAYLRGVRTKLRSERRKGALERALLLARHLEAQASPPPPVSALKRPREDEPDGGAHKLQRTNADSPDVVASRLQGREAREARPSF